MHLFGWNIYWLKFIYSLWKWPSSPPEACLHVLTDIFLNKTDSHTFVLFISLSNERLFSSADNFIVFSKFFSPNSNYIACLFSCQVQGWILAQASGVPAVGVQAVDVQAVDCWQWHSGHYFHNSFLLFPPRFLPVFPTPSRPFLIEEGLG